MRDAKSELSKISALKWILIAEIGGFLFIILTCWVTEFYDPPFSWSQVLIETAAITIFGCLTVYSTWQFVRRIKYLEGFLVICASCKRIKEIDGRWVNIEQIISSKSELQFSHGVCPECAKKLYGEYL